METSAKSVTAPEAAADLPAGSDDLPATTRRRPTRAAQARAAAAATATPVVEAPPASPEEALPSRPARTRSTREPRPPREAAAPAVETPTAEPASPPASSALPASVPVGEEAPVPQPRRDGHERFDRSQRDNRPRDERPREERQREERPRDDRQRHQHPQQQRHRDQGFQRDQQRHPNQQQRHRDQRQPHQRPGFREDNRGNRATERELREMREAREFAEAMVAEQGLEPVGPPPEFDVHQLPSTDIADLYELARQLNIFNYRRLRKHELIYRIMQTQTDEAASLVVKGVLEILPEGYGFLRVSEYLPSPDDIYVSQTQIRRYDLWSGDVIEAQVRAPKEGEKYFSLVKIEMINGQPDISTARRIPFENLTPIYPCERLKLETTSTNLSMRLMDLFNPLGKGQRALIVSPPKAGKTTLLKQVANSISENHPEVHLIALLIDERPEEVTDMQRSINGEVVASTFDELPENHIRVAELVMEKAKRQVENGKDVVILLDSITRLARAYNSAMPPSGRTLSGGLDPNAMHKPKRFFGAARKLERSGSLTIIATALIDTGSRMDEVIYEEFKGTGNSELTLDRRLADRRIFPAIDIKRSSTRKEELLLTPEELRKQRILRKTMDAGDTAEVTEFLADRLSRTKSNAEFLMAISDS